MVCGVQRFSTYVDLSAGGNVCVLAGMAIPGTITAAEHNIGGREYLPGVLLRRGVETSIWHATTRIARVRAV
jgi:hypothetical protein